MRHWVVAPARRTCHAEMVVPQCFCGIMGPIAGHTQGCPSYMPSVYAQAGTKKGGSDVHSGPPSLLPERAIKRRLPWSSRRTPTLYPLLNLMRQPGDATLAEPYPLGELAFEFEAPDVHAAIGDAVNLLQLRPRAKLQLMRHRVLRVGGTGASG